MRTAAAQQTSPLHPDRSGAGRRDCTKEPITDLEHAEVEPVAHGVRAQ